MSSFLLPKLVQQYELQELIGEGNNSYIYKGYKRPFRIPLAIKVISKSQLISQAQIRHINEEANLMQQLTHHNIAKSYDFFEDFNYFYLVSEFCPGGSLLDYLIKNRLLRAQEASMAFFQLVEAIRFLHRRNIIHRDIKPSNILIDKFDTFTPVVNTNPENARLKMTKSVIFPPLLPQSAMTKSSVNFPTVTKQLSTEELTTIQKAQNLPPIHAPIIKIIDFGHSYKMNENNQLQTYSGTSCYQPPEVLKHLDYDGKKWDMWSLGVTLYEIVTGSHPWITSNAMTMYHQITYAEFNIPDYVHPELARIIRALIVVDPDRRLTIEELYNDPYLQAYKVYSSSKPKNKPSYTHSPLPLKQPENKIIKSKSNSSLLETRTRRSMTVSQSSDCFTPKKDDSNHQGIKISPSTIVSRFKPKKKPNEVSRLRRKTLI